MNVQFCHFLAILSAIILSSYQMHKRVNNTFKIIGSTTISGQLVWVTDDAIPDQMPLECGWHATQKCKITTVLSQPRNNGTTWYFLNTDGIFHSGAFTQ